jgi:TP901 family phage tail tape measure protein
MIGLLGSGASSAANQMLLVGAGLTAVGAAFTAAGAAGVAFFADATSAAVEYNRQTSLTLTQIDQVGVTVDQVGAIAKRVAHDIPAPFDQMQKSLYDIFSSMNVNVSQAETLLTEFSKGAVAGQVDIQDAARSSISIMNAFKIPVENVNHVMDVQFQLVRKGVGTYGEFAATIGRVTPSAVAAGQSLESMSGMLAFLTRNGLSTAMAATSAARAMDLLARPATTKNLEAMGVKTKDASGNFLQMRDIIGQLVNDKGWNKLTGPELKQAFTDVFGGQGTIQARRFFDLVIPNFQEFSSLTDDMANSAGAMGTAYDTMSETTASKLQLLSNRFDILKVNIGEKLMPVIEKVADFFMRLADAWESLSPGMQDLIVKVVAFASVMSIVVGIIFVAVGLYLIFAAAASIAGVALSSIGIVIGAVIVGFLALVAVGYLIISNWSTLVDFFSGLFDPIVGSVQTGVEAIRSAISTAFDWITNTAIPALGNAWTWVTGKIGEFVGWLQGTALPFVQYWVQSILEQFNLFANWWTEHVGPVIGAVGELLGAIGTRISEAMSTIWNIIQIGWDIIQNITNAVWPPLRDLIINTWNEISTGVSSAMNTIWNIIQIAWDIIQNIITFATGFIKMIIDTFGDNIVDGFQIVWDLIKGIVEGALLFVQGIIQTVTGIIQGDWGKVWEGIKNILQGAWNVMFAIVSSAIELIANIIRVVIDTIAGFFGSSWDNIRNVLANAWNGMVNAVTGSVAQILTTVSGMPGQIIGFLQGIDLFGIGKSILESLLNGLKNAWENIVGFLSGLADKIKELKGPPAKDAKLLVNNGMLVMGSLGEGLDRGWNRVEKQLNSYNPAIQGIINTSGPVGKSGTGTRLTGSITVQSGAFQFNIDNATEDTKRMVQEGIQAAMTQLADQMQGFDEGMG